jgi:hypothetical protein
MLNFFVKITNLTNNFNSFVAYKKKDPRQKKVCKGLGLVHCQRLYANSCCWKPLPTTNGFASKPLCVLANQKQVVEKVIPNLVEKMTSKHVLCMLGHCITMITSFDLSMSRFWRDNKFALVINFVNEQNWQPCHIIVGLFETTNTLGFIMAS